MAVITIITAITTLIFIIHSHHRTMAVGEIITTVVGETTERNKSKM